MQTTSNHVSTLESTTSAPRLIAILRSTLIVTTCSWVLALSSQMALPLPWTPVPLTLQTFTLMMLTPMLGTRRSIAMVVAYLAQGAIGFPFFSGGRGGLAVLLSPTGGYLIGFIGAVALIGFAHQKRLLQTWSRRVVVFALSSALVLAAGTAAIAAFSGWPVALSIGAAPFISGEIIKAVTAASLWNKRLS